MLQLPPREVQLQPRPLAAEVRRGGVLTRRRIVQRRTAAHGRTRRPHGTCGSVDWHGGGTCEERRPGLRLLEDVAHGGAGPVEQVDVRRGHAALDEEPHELLDHEAHAVVDVQQGLVAHVEGAHELQHGDLEGEVEGRDEADGAVRPPQAVAALAGVVAGYLEAPGHEPDLQHDYQMRAVARAGLLS